MMKRNYPMRKNVGPRAIPRDYPAFLKDLKARIQSAQVRAAFAVNAELLRLYWDVGRSLIEQQSTSGWGARVLSRLAVDLKNEFPEVKGFSERNLKLMTQFYREYPKLFQKGQPPVAQLPVSEYELTRALPKKFKSKLPTVKEIEQELSSKE